VTAITDFNHGTEFAPKIEGCYNGTGGWGFRVSYFYTNQKARIDVAATAPPGIISIRPLNVISTGQAQAGTTATFRERLRIQYFDGEGSYRWKGATYLALFSAGIRVVPTTQVYTATDISRNEPENLKYTQERTDIGPSVVGYAP
jgi:hypothetical protein